MSCRRESGGEIVLVEGRKMELLKGRERREERNKVPAV